MKNKNGIIAISILVIFIIGFFVLKSFYLNQTADTSQNTTQITDSSPSNTNQKSTGFRVVPADAALLERFHSPSLGPKDAKVTIVEFLDPECEACRAMYPITKKIMEEFKGQVRLVVRYMPFHQNSMYAANILEAAREQGKYWEALDTMFATQREWASHHDPKPELILTFLKKHSLDIKKIETLALAGKFNEQINQDKEDGEKLGVRATPTFYVNGQQVYEMGYEPLRNEIQSRLQ